MNTHEYPYMFSVERTSLRAQNRGYVWLRCLWQLCSFSEKNLHECHKHHLISLTPCQRLERSKVPSGHTCQCQIIRIYWLLIKWKLLAL